MPLSASHQRLIRRRLLGATESDLIHPMKKKKPKKSFASKSPPKGGSESKSSPSSSPAGMPLYESFPISGLLDSNPPFASDAQAASIEGLVAQQIVAGVDLELALVSSESEKTEIATQMADPSSMINSVDLEASAMTSSDPPLEPVAPVATSNLAATEVVIQPDSQVSKELPAPLETCLETNEDSKSASEGSVKPPPSDLPRTAQPVPPNKQANDWCAAAKGFGKPLKKTGEAFTLPSGEACIKISNSVIEKNKKSWEQFIIGQFYSDPPAQGTIHNIVNGIWSKHYRDIAVSKMEGNAYLFRIPNAATRHRVVYQRLWQIEGQTMFVDNWEPGVIPAKPELTSAPIWLELRKVPLQFFNEECLGRIAGLVGEPKYLHPTTANQTNLEVAKVFTVIDPRKPLPEAVNVQFENGVISRILVSSPWMPPICQHCREIGHSLKRCPQAPKTCLVCNSSSHDPSSCPRKFSQNQSQGQPKKKTRRSKSKDKNKWVVVGVARTEQDRPPNSTSSREILFHNSKLGSLANSVPGESSSAKTSAGIIDHLFVPEPRDPVSSDVDVDSSDVDSSGSELEEGQFVDLEKDFKLVSGRNYAGPKGSRGRSPKSS